MTLSVHVFCSSAGGLPEVYRSAARDLGAELAARGHRLVYGSGGVGLMGEVARSVLMQRHRRRDHPQGTGRPRAGLRPGRRAAGHRHDA